MLTQTMIIPMPIGGGGPMGPVTSLRGEPWYVGTFVTVFVFFFVAILVSFAALLFRMATESWGDGDRLEAVISFVFSGLMATLALALVTLMWYVWFVAPMLGVN